MSRSDPKKSSSAMRAVGMASAIGADLVFCMVAGYFLGSFMQNWFGGHPIWLVVGIMIGFIAGVIGLVLLLRHYLGERNG
jgi:F0F1-type ATP synthase assembly protein I